MHIRKIILRIVICSMLATLLAGCNGAGATATANDLWVIFPESRAKEMRIGTWLSSGADFGGYWTPTEEDVLNLEGQLRAFLSQNFESFNRQPPVWEQLDNYKRQYAGVTIKGRKVIYGNFFCTDSEMNWTSEWIFILDGGDCYFQLQFDVESGTFTELTVNGEA